MLKEFLSRRPIREKMIFYCALFFILLVFLDRLVLNPIILKINSLNTEIQKQETTIRKNLRIIQQKERIKEEENKYTSFYPSRQRQSEEEEISALLKEIENMAKVYSLRIIGLKPVNTDAASSSGEYLINLNCEAKITDFINFMYNIEYSKDILSIKKFNIAPQSPESEIAKYNITISKIIIP